MAGPYTETFNNDQTGWGVSLGAWYDLATAGGATGLQQIVFHQATCSGVGQYACGGPTQLASNDNNEARVSANQMVLSTQSVIGVRVRFTAIADTGYEFLRVGAATLGGFTVIIYKVQGGVRSVVGSSTIVARAALNTAEILRCTVVSTAFGQLVTGYINDVQVLSGLDSTSMITTGTGGGMVIRGAAARDTYAENFSFGDIGTTGQAKTLSAASPTASSAKASVKLVTAFNAKVATTSSAKANLGINHRISTKAPTSASATGALTTLVEGFNVKRPLTAKAATSSNAKSSLNKIQTIKSFSAKVATSSSAKAPFLREAKRLKTTAPTFSSSAKATRLIRAIRWDGKMFQSNSAKGHFTGGHNAFVVKVPTSSSAKATMSGGRVTFVVVLSNTSNISITEFIQPEFVAVFLCPTDLEDPPTLPGHPGNRLFKYYRARPVGRNVFIYSNNTVSEVEPDGYSTLWFESQRTSDTLANAPHVIHVFWGGHEASLITPTERTLLIAAGYTVSQVPV